MAIIKRRPRRSKDFFARKFFRQNKFHANSELQSSPWKIFSMLIFLAIVIVLLLKNDDPESGEQVDKKIIPNPETPINPSYSQLYTFKNAAISSDSQVCSEIARDLLREQSANIYDSAISTMVCNALMSIQSTGLLGGFMLTAHVPSANKSIIIDAQIVAPKDFVMPNSNDFEIVKYGGLSIGVPGFLPGILEIHRKFSKLPLNEILRPIIDVCKNGIILTKHLKDSIELNPRILNDTYLNDLFVDKSTGKIKRIGSKIIMRKQCKFLELLSSHKTNDDLYSGKIGAILMNDLKHAKSVISLDDLKSYKVQIYEAKTVDIDDENAVLVPNSLALLIPTILKILVKYNFNETSFLTDELHINQTILNYHRIVEAFKYASALRSQFGDPNFINSRNITNYMLSNEFTDKIIKSINESFVHEDIKKYGLKNLTPHEHGTSHISIALENQEAISVTSSINYYFGSSLCGNISGLIFNNGMDDFSYTGRSQNYFGLQETPTNYPEAGKRALSSVAPIIVINKKTKQTKMVIGAAGGSKIISALSLTILRYICCSKNLKEIIDEPRFHHQLLPNVLEYEYGIINSIVEGLSNTRGHKMHRYRNRGTIINALTLDENHIYAISDYRKDLSGVAGF